MPIEEGRNQVDFESFNMSYRSVKENTDDEEYKGVGPNERQSQAVRPSRN